MTALSRAVVEAVLGGSRALEGWDEDELLALALALMVREIRRRA